MNSATSERVLESLKLREGKDHTLPLINHIIDCIATLRDAVERQKEEVESEKLCIPANTYGLYMSKLLNNSLGKAATFIMTNDFTVPPADADPSQNGTANENGSRQAINGYHKVSEHIFELFPHFTKAKGNVGNKTLIHHAAFRHAASSTDGGEDLSSKAFEILLQSHPEAANELDSMGATALHWATRNKSMTKSVLMTLLRANPNAPMVKDQTGYLPIHWAVCQDEPSEIIVQTLLTAYPEGLLKPCVDGTLPLHWCVNRCKPKVKIVKMLLDANKSSAGVSDKDGCTPLHKCVNREDPDVEVAQMLIDACAEALEITDKEGHLPLHLAIDHDKPNVEVAKLLLSANPASASIKDKHGHLPLHCLLDNPQPDFLLAELVLEAYPMAAEVQTEEGMYPVHILTNVCEDPSPHFTSELLNLFPSAVRHEVIDSVPVDPTANIHVWTGDWKEVRWTPFGRATERNLFKIVPVLRSARFKAICKSNADGDGEGGIRKTIGGTSRGSSLSPERPGSPGSPTNASPGFAGIPIRIGNPGDRGRAAPSSKPPLSALTGQALHSSNYAAAKGIGGAAQKYKAPESP